MKKWLIFIVLGIIIVGGFLLISNKGTDSDSDGELIEVDKVIVITGENFKFIIDGVDNPEIIVNEGDKIRIEFSSTSGFHDWVVDEFNVATEKVRENDGVTIVEFVADQKGEFEYYCSVGAHREQGMFGRLVVV